jgi:preprotein translocase subunit SecD
VTFAGSSPLGPEATRRTADRIRARVKALGLRDARVEEGDGTVTVTGPTADEKRLTGLGDSGRIGFRPVLALEPLGTSPTPASRPSPSADPARQRAVTEGLRPRTAGSPSAGTATGTDEEGAADAALRQRFSVLDCSKGQRPATEAQAANRPRDSVVACGAGGDGSPPVKYALGPTAVDGTRVASAEAVHDEQTGNWAVSLDFDSLGARQFSAVTADLSTRQSPENQFAIVLDGAVISAPSVGQALTGGTAEISGSFTRTSAEELAANLGSGALPKPLTVTGVTRLPHG